MRSRCKSTRKRAVELEIKRGIKQLQLKRNLGLQAFRPVAINELMDKIGLYSDNFGAHTDYLDK